MTPEERARAVLEHRDCQMLCLYANDDALIMHRHITAAIREAVAAERERCAKLIEGYTTNQPTVGITYHGEALARVIRGET